MAEIDLNVLSGLLELLGDAELWSASASSIGRLSSLAVVSFAGGALVGLCLLFLSETTAFVVWLYRALFLLIWLSAFMVPLVQGSNSVFRPTTQRLFNEKMTLHEKMSNIISN